MALSPDHMENLLEELKMASSDQLLLVNKHTADLYKLAQRVEGRKKMQQMAEGTRVIISGNIKPKYLQRQFGTIEEIRDTRVVVKLDKGPMGKFRTGRVIASPSSLVILENQPVRD